MADSDKVHVAYLEILDGPKLKDVLFFGKVPDTTVLEINSGIPIAIGRHPRLCNLRVYDYDAESSVSRTHCTIAYYPEFQCFMITDENSANGTFLKGLRLEAATPTALHDQDIVELGKARDKGLKLKFSFREIRQTLPSVKVPKATMEIGSKKHSEHEDVLREEDNLSHSAKDGKATKPKQEDDFGATHRLSDDVLAMASSSSGEAMSDSRRIASISEVQAAQLRAKANSVVSQQEIQADIFISYSPDDIKEMEPIRDHLVKTYSFRIRTDVEAPQGDGWQSFVEIAISQSHIFVLLMSPKAKANGLVQKQLEFANNSGKLIFAVLIEGDDNNAIPDLLVGGNFADLTGVKFITGLDNLAKDIKEKLDALRGKT